MKLHIKGVLGLEGYRFSEIKYITNLKNEQYDPDNKEYIVSREDLRIKSNDICNSLKHPITIININYGSKHYIDSRVDSDASYYAIRPTCRNFRVAAGEKYCMECDNYYAQYCKEMLEEGTYHTQPLDFFSESCKKNLPNLTNAYERTFLVYDCPMLGYREMCYPIFFYGKIIGFLIVGEILLHIRSQTKENIAKEFLLQQKKKMLSSYIQKWEKVHPGNSFNERYITIDILSSENILEDYEHNLFLHTSDYKHVLTDEEFDDLIYQCCEETKKLEKYLENQWKAKQKNTYQRIINSMKNSFNQKYIDIRAQNEITYNEVRDLVSVIWDVIIEMKRKFNFQYCRLFENSPYISGEDASTKNILRIGECQYDKDQLKCDFSKVPLSMTICNNSLESSKDNPLLCFFTYSGVSIDSNTNVALACENLAVLFGIDESLESHKNESIVILFKEISNFFLQMSTDLDRISTLFIRQQHEKTLHMYRHECAHLAQRIQKNNRYYSSRERYEFLSIEKRENIFRDIKSVAVMLQHLSTNIGLLLGSVNEEKLKEGYKQVDIRDELNKWRAMFRLELKKRKLRIFNNIAPIDFNIRFNTHEELFTIILFNLIDNAVKYSYWGTNICCEVLPGQVIIKNYGIEIEAGPRPYDMYYRDKRNVENNLGDGIGLYSSKKAANILGLELFHTCEKISDYNIPLVFEANKRELEIVDFDLDIVVKELGDINIKDVLTPSNYYDEEDCKIAESTIKRDIKKATYCVTFVIKGL